MDALPRVALQLYIRLQASSFFSCSMFFSFSLHGRYSLTLCVPVGGDVGGGGPPNVWMPCERVETGPVAVDLSLCEEP